MFAPGNEAMQWGQNWAEEIRKRESGSKNREAGSENREAKIGKGESGDENQHVGKVRIGPRLGNENREPRIGNCTTGPPY